MAKPCAGCSIADSGHPHISPFVMRRGESVCKGCAFTIDAEPCVVHAFADVAAYVAREHSDLGPADAEALAETINFDSDAPAFGTDWAEWLSANIERLKDAGGEARTG